MANIAYSAIVSDARGSVGGVTLSRGRGGAIARARIKPVNPRSFLQSTRRANVAYLAKYWSSELTEQQREDWRAYAAGTTWTNKLGQTISGTGNAAFLRLNVLHRMIPSDVIAEAPTATGHGGGVVLTFSAESDTGLIQLDLPTGAFDKDTELHNVWISIGLPTEPGHISPPKGFRFIGRIWGSNLEPLVFPYELTAPYTMRAGQHITLRAMWHDEHYRVAGPFFATATAAPSI